MKIFDCIIIGGGAAGLFCSSIVGEQKNVLLIEKNKAFGRKLLITGKGRCNLTNDCDLQTLLNNVRTNSRFLYSAFSQFSSQDTMLFFENLGVPLKVERGNRVFPVSDKSLDIVNSLVNKIKKSRVTTVNTEVISVIKDKNIFLVKLKDGTLYSGHSLVIATGGKSYPLTGSTGQGYNFAKNFGHTIVPITPSLVPIVTEETAVCKKLQGLSLKNTFLRVLNDGKTVYSDFGEMLFTHFGLSGPMILSSSAHVKNGDKISLDLKPALSEKQLDNRLLSDFEKYINKNFSNALSDLLPSKLIPVIIEFSGISPYEKVNNITKEQRKNLVCLLKNFTFTVKGLRPIEEAIITSGGVSVKEINPKTMESKIVDNLYFAGEIIDCDAYTGGFNLQIAFSTAFVAAQSVLGK